MMITEEMIAEDKKRWNDRNIVAELGYCGKNIRHRKNITNDDIRFYAYIMRKAHDTLKEQETEIERLKRPDCEHAMHDGIGCLGYCGCTQDDEPIESCKRCEKYTGNVCGEV